MRSNTMCRLSAATILVISVYWLSSTPELAPAPGWCKQWPCNPVFGWTEITGQWTASAPGSPWTVRGTALDNIYSTGGSNTPSKVTGKTFDLYNWTQSGSVCAPPPGASVYESSPPGTAIPKLMVVGAWQYYCPP
jgi:hypothetical protein